MSALPIFSGQCIEVEMSKYAESPSKVTRYVRSELLMDWLTANSEMAASALPADASEVSPFEHEAKSIGMAAVQMAAAVRNEFFITVIGKTCAKLIKNFETGKYIFAVSGRCLRIPPLSVTTPRRVPVLVGQRLKRLKNRPKTMLK